MDDHGSDHNGHEGGANEEGIFVLEGCIGWEFKDKIVVDPCTLPHEQVAPIHEQMQTQQRNNAAKVDHNFTINISIINTSFILIIFCECMNKIDDMH